MSDPQALHELMKQKIAEWRARDSTFAIWKFAADELEALLSTPPQRQEEPERTTALELLEHVQRGHTQVKHQHYILCSCNATFWFADKEPSR